MLEQIRQKKDLQEDKREGKKQLLKKKNGEDAWII